MDSSSASASGNVPTRQSPDGAGGGGSALGRFFAELFEVGRQAALGDVRRLQALLYRLLRDHALGDVAAGRQLEHHVEQGVLDDRPKAASSCLALDGLVCDRPERVFGEDELDMGVREEAVVL